MCYSMKDNSKCKTRIIVSIAIAVIFILIFLLQSNIPMLGYDDFILNSSNGKGVAYLIAEIESSIKYWNGRSSQIIGYLIGFCPSLYILDTKFFSNYFIYISCILL